MIKEDNMWTNSELKSNARSLLKNYYWKAVLVCVIFGVLTGTIGFSRGANSVNSFRNLEDNETFQEIIEHYQDKNDDRYETTALVTQVEEKLAESSSSGNMVVLDSYDFDYDFDDHDYSYTKDQYGAIMGAIFGVVMVIVVIAVIIGSLWAILFTNVLTVGKHRYFIESRYHETGVGELFSSFTNGRYSNTMKVMFFHSLYISLWSLLFIIPGIIKSYEYFLVPYLVAENPDIDKDRAFEISKRTMEGEKWKCFVLGLSFILWNIAANLVPFGVGNAFLDPYISATFVEFYMAMKAKAVAHGIVYPGELVDDESRANVNSFNASPAGFNQQSMNSGYNSAGFAPQNNTNQGYNPYSGAQGQGYGAPQGTPQAPAQNAPQTSFTSGSYPSGSMDSIDPQNNIGSPADISSQAYPSGTMDSVGTDGNFSDSSFDDPAIGESNFRPDDNSPDGLNS